MNKDDWSIRGPYVHVDGSEEFILWHELIMKDYFTLQELTWFLKMKYCEYAHQESRQIHVYTFTDAGWEYIKLRYLL
jgi:hypothetical protein